MKQEPMLRGGLPVQMAHTRDWRACRAWAAAQRTAAAWQRAARTRTALGRASAWGPASPRQCGRALTTAEHASWSSARALTGSLGGRLLLAARECSSSTMITPSSPEMPTRAVRQDDTPWSGTTVAALCPLWSSPGLLGFCSTWWACCMGGRHMQRMAAEVCAS